MPTAPEDRLIAQLRQFPEVRRIYLYGSRARGDADPRSDIDLAVSCPRATPEAWLRIHAAAEDAQTLLLIDLVRLEEVSDPLRTRILTEGRILYDRQA